MDFRSIADCTCCLKMVMSFDLNLWLEIVLDMRVLHQPLSCVMDRETAQKATCFCTWCSVYLQAPWAFSVPMHWRFGNWEWSCEGLCLASPKKLPPHSWSMPEQSLAAGHHRALSVPKKDSSARMEKEGRAGFEGKKLSLTRVFWPFAKKDKKTYWFLRKMEKWQ